MGLLILDIQHTGKPHARDFGASHDIDGDGRIECHEREALLTPVYAGAAQVAAESAGHDVKVMLAGTYATRQARANAMARGRPNEPVLYVACHLNAGGGDYGLVLYDARSRMGEAAAGHVVKAMSPYWTPRKVRTLAPQATSRDSTRWPRPYRTIRGVFSGPRNICGICFEPLFIDTHADLVADRRELEQVGRHLAAGFHRWAASWA